MVSAIVGREAELGLVRRFLSDVGHRLVGLHLHGEAGIGKSTIWHSAISDAAHRGYQVVNTRPTEAEAQLPFAGLNDLFGSLLDDVQPDLPAPQRLAIDAALLRASIDGPRPEPLAVSLAILGLLRAAVATWPVVVAVDDVPWLDASSASVLEFALRRLDDAPIGLLIAQRTSGEEIPHPPLMSAVPAERIHQVRVAPLSLRDTDRLLAGALDLELPPSTLSRVHRASGGNPFYAIEVARALQRRGETGTEGELVLPETLTALVRDRLDALSEAAAVAVAHASAMSHPSMEVLAVAIGRHKATAGVADAVAAGILVVTEGAVRFTHPILAAEAYGRLGEGERLMVHRGLADALTEPEEHATHLALSATGEDEAIAKELDDAAERANERGAPDAAAALAERAVALSPRGIAGLARRRLAVARFRLRAGDLVQARGSLESALQDVSDGGDRAEILLLLGQVRLLSDDWRAAERLFDEALSHAGTTRQLIEIKVQLAGVSYVTLRRWEEGAAHIADAMRLAEQLGDPEDLAGTIGHYAMWQWDTGGGASEALERRAAELEPWTAHLRVMDHPDLDFARIKAATGDEAGSRALLEGLLARAEDRGDYSSIPELLANLTRVDFYDGRADAALTRLDDAERLARATGQRTALLSAVGEQAITLSRLGRGDAAWKAGRAAISMATELGTRKPTRVREELALLELSRHNFAGALEALGRPLEPDADGADGRPDATLPVRAEALIGLGQLEEARAELDRFERDFSRFPLPLASADADSGVARSRALLAAAGGDLEEATRLVTEALETYAAVKDRWSQARTLLVAGEIHRRSRRRAPARAALTEALALFDHFGAHSWADRAREQLERTGAGRDDVRGLTPTQLQVAELAIDGLTNRQIADRLFMSPHTVEAHLSAAYRILGIGSRRELGASLRAPPTDGPE